MHKPTAIAHRSRRDCTRDTIGSSEAGRPLQVIYIGQDTAPLRLLFIASQHGDESQSGTAVSQFAQAFRPDAAGSPGVCLAIMPNLNPDGAAQGIRENARGIDLNRDHQLLRSAETQALHRFVRTWRPHLIVDVHTYPPRRKHILRHGLIYCHDVFVDVPTNPSCSYPMLGQETERFLPPIIEALRSRGFRSDRYTLINTSGRVRHSTPDVVDARNGLALRYGIFTVLLEGQSPVRDDDPAVRARLHSALQATLELIIRWAEQNRETLLCPPSPPKADDWVTVHSRYVRADSRRTMAFRETQTGLIRQVELPGKYTSHVKATKHVKLPRAYAIPRIHTTLIEVLRRHGFPSHPADPGRIELVERYRIQDMQPSKRPRRPPRKLSVRLCTEQQVLKDHLLFPVTFESGRALAVFLEPESKYGLLRFGEMELCLEPGLPYPVLRIPTNRYERKGVTQR